MADLNSLSDLQLFDLFKSGNVNAFGKIYDRHRTPLVVFVNSMVKDQDIAQDIVQEVFTVVFQRAQSLEINSSEHLANYLYRAVRFKVFNAIKHEQTKTNYLESIANFASESYNQADQDVHLKELAEIIEATVQSMQPRMREIFNLSRKQHLSHKEIAELLSLTENTVSTQIQRALFVLRNNKEIQNSLLLIALHLLQYKCIF
ncbi:RNA polymerase sigma-70 factor, ECF subfamily [Pedobacter westerhofensis]|uniref:RNA polymerase sigma-70 factor, ECF subfamily n=1 Tax=Pedobacter westerhofensis TaxID=425512 RepID=A0A521EAU5_9SPHI|nr:RNA polymerase sigma-70 factor [Pedobacter westerhofensis]SMO81044.1 RNA polymerase sigma-70 factor, ECF subfamily [Pedobacter westerhofensis]